MSRYHDRGITAILDAAAEWAQRCLVHDGSVFGNDALWTSAHFAELDKYFVRNLDEGTGSFLEKLASQLAPASPAARKLMAELMWVLYLFPSNMRAPAKREALTKVWRTSGEELSAGHRFLADEVLDGIGSGGTAYFAAIWREFNYAITLFSAFKALPGQQRAALVGDYGKFADWLQSAPREGNRQLRHMLRYVLFPDVVERMSTNSDRFKVLDAFGVVSARDSKTWTDRQIDEAMLALRARLAAKHGTDSLDFYLPPLKEQWKSEENTSSDGTNGNGGAVHEDTPPPYRARSAPPLNQILFGPPGTGKTYHTVNKALDVLDAEFVRVHAKDRAALKARFDALVREGLVQFVTFHQSFSYEDFVEGLRAEPDGTTGALRYPVVSGVFKQLCIAAGEGSDEGNRPRVLIIDEINRGNVSRIFGELITLIEPSKRAGAVEALEVVLPYSQKKFSVPANVHLIGTMNTADRSLAGLDIALRRRFRFIEMPPQPDLLKHTIVAGVNVGDLLEVMNKRIEALLDRDHQLGHTYFMDLASGDDIQALAAVFREHIVPLLQEYFFEDWERIHWVLNDHRKPAGCQFVIEEELDAIALFGNRVTVDARARSWRVNPSAFDNPKSYSGILASAVD